MEITSTVLHDLARARSGPCVSITLPTHRTADAEEADRTLLRDLVHVAAEAAERNGAPEPLLASLRAIPDREGLLDHPQEGLAVYLSDGTECVIELDRETVSSATVDDHFDLVPLVPALDDATEFAVLALSLNDTRLFGGTIERLVEIDAPALPHGLDESLRIDERPRASRTRDGDISRYLRLVDEAVRATISGPDVPLVVAGVRDLTERFVAISDHPGPVLEAPSGNAEPLSAHELGALAAPVVRELVSKRRAELCAQIDEGLPTASTIDRFEVVRAAEAGRVRSLAVDPLLADPALASRAVAATLRLGGQVFAVDSPALGADGLAALLRYPHERHVDLT